MELFLLLYFLHMLEYYQVSSGLVTPLPQKNVIGHALQHEESYTDESRVLSHTTSTRHTRSVEPTNNQTITLVLESLKEINDESNIVTQNTKATILGTNLAQNQSLVMSDYLKSYVYSILSNITFVGDQDVTNGMIRDLETMYKEETTVAFNYTNFRMRDTDEQRLLRSLMMNYEKAVRPVLKASDPILLEVGLTLNQIDVDEKNQVLTALVWLDQEWTDEKLIWDPKEYSNLTVLRVPCKLLWLPDIVLYNSVDDMKGGYMQALAMVSHNGKVFWPPIVKFNGACEIKIKYFPFDDQMCKLKLGTWSYDGSQVNMTKRSKGIDLTTYQSNGEWKLMHTDVIRNVVFYPCCAAPYIDITFYVYMRRRTLYYTYNIIIPCVMLSILTLLCFWMKPDSGEKISLGLTILLAFSVFMLLIAENMPSTSVHVPIIGIYITSSMCITAFSVIVGVFVANVNHQADGDREVPYWVHKMCYALSKVTCLKMVSYEERHYNIKMLALQARLVLPSMSNSTQNHKRRKSVSRTEELRNEVRNGSISLAEAQIAHAGGKKLNEQCEKSKAKNPSESDPLLKRLHSIVQHQEELLHKQNTTEDWHLVAIVIDRCLFWFYLLMMISTTIGCLVIFPLTKSALKGADNSSNAL